jgi:dUTP pyrophosphatase
MTYAAMNPGGTTPGGTTPGGLTPIVVLVSTTEPDVPLPTYAHPGDAGADITTRVAVSIAPGERVTVPTGLMIALPAGYAAFVHPRSGLAAKHGLTIVNAPGTVDAGYRGEIAITLLNTDATDTVTLAKGDRIAQLVIQAVERATFAPVESLPGSHRGDAGFGSSGVASSGPASSGTAAPGAASSGTAAPGAASSGTSS